MKILAADLGRICYNAQTFSSKDSSLGGVVMFNMLRRLRGDGTYDTTCQVYASDDYVAMKDEAPAVIQSGVDEVFHLGLKEVKELEKFLRDKEGEVRVEPHQVGGDNYIHVMKDVPDGVDGVSLHIVSEPPDFSGVVEVVHSEPNPFTGEFSPSAEPFAIRAERFTKFRLLRTPESPSTRDGYPVDFLWDGQVIRWKCGPFLKGAVGPLARRSFKDIISGIEVTGIKDLYAEEEGVLW